MRREYAVPPCSGLAVDVRAAVSACSVKESVTNGGRCAGLVLVVADRAESRL